MVATACGDGQAGSGNKPGNTCLGGPGHKTQGSTCNRLQHLVFFFGINWDLDGFGIIWNCTDPHNFSRLRGFVMGLSAVLSPASSIFKNLASNSARLESTA